MARQAYERMLSHDNTGIKSRSGHFVKVTEEEAEEVRENVEEERKEGGPKYPPKQPPMNFQCSSLGCTEV